MYAKLLLAFLAALAPLPLVARARARLVPGQGIGIASLGSPRTAIWKHYGRPTDSSIFRWRGHVYREDDWNNGSGRRGLTVLSERGQLVQIETIGIPYRGRDGLTDGSTFGQIRQRHPGMQVGLKAFRQEVGGLIYADDVRRGIAWTADVHYFDNFPTYYLPHLRPIGVIIHRPGRRVLPNSAVAEYNQQPEPGWRHDVRAWFAHRK